MIACSSGHEWCWSWVDRIKGELFKSHHILQGSNELHFWTIIRFIFSLPFRENRDHWHWWWRKRDWYGKGPSSCRWSHHSWTGNRQQCFHWPIDYSGRVELGWVSFGGSLVHFAPVPSSLKVHSTRRPGWEGCFQEVPQFVGKGKNMIYMLAASDDALWVRSNVLIATTRCTFACWRRKLS